MTTESHDRVQELFLAVCEKSPDERDAYLRRSCGQNEDLRREVESLLASDRMKDSFLQTPLLAQRPASSSADAARSSGTIGIDKASKGVVPDFESHQSCAPKRIGHYLITDVLGEGGMGVVYRAEQKSPRRTVALKVIKPGAESQELLKRFAQESQVLGCLQHPGIAQVIEAGTADTEHGRQPFFAMEFVDGQPLNEYAKNGELDTTARLELMVKVCDAVHHAHQKGVIHRDLKPGNILVDAAGEPKILDFGVARATDADVRTTTLQTDAGKLVGTIAYMSPEQIVGDPRELDARSDVYALGVVLYEILAERHPHDVTNKTIPQVARLITEEEATHLSSIDRTYRGDIETIVAKALEKDKSRRYQSASSLALDLRRFLADQPITARPATTLYQLQKFARRNKALVASVAFAFVALAGALVWMTIERNRSIKAEQLAESRRLEAERQAAMLQVVNDFLHKDLLQSADPHSGQPFDATVRSVLDRASEKLDERYADEPLHEAALHATLGVVYRNLGDANLAEAHIGKALELRKSLLGDEHRETLNTTGLLAQVYKNQGRFDEVVALLEPLVEACRRKLGDRDTVTLNAMSGLATAYKDLGQFEESEALFKETLSLQRQHLGVEASETLTTMNNLANVYQGAGKLNEAIDLLAETLPLNQRILGEDHPDTLQTMTNLGIDHKQLGHLDEALGFLSDAFARQKRVLGEDHPSTLNTANSLGLLYVDLGRFDDAEKLLLSTLDGRRMALGEEHHRTLDSMSNLAGFYARRGRYEEAEPLALEALEKTRRVMGDDDAGTVGRMNVLANIYREMEQFDKAEPFALAALEARRHLFGGDHPRTLTSMQTLAIIYRRQGRLDDAKTLMQETYDLKVAKLGADHMYTLNSANNLANLLAQMGRYEEAEKLHRDTLARRRRVLGESHPRTFSSIGNLAEVYYLQGDHERAVPLCRKAYEGNREAHGPTHWRTLEVLERLAESLIKLDRSDQAAAVLEESLNDAFAEITDGDKLAQATEKRIALLDRCGGKDRADRFRSRLEDAGLSHSAAKP